MARNGSGTYNLLTNSWNPATNGVSATPVDWQNLINDVAAALTQSLSADGQTPVTGNINMGGNKLTSLSTGNGTGQSVAWQQLFSQGVEADIASASTVDIGAQNTNFLRITGTTTITSFGTNYNGPRFIRFGDALTLTHNATTLILPTAANIITTAGDRAIVTPIGSPGAGWQVIAYQRADGTALLGADTLNTTRIDVASAGTVNLTSSAPNTRHINITGTTTITNFTVAIGQCYFVRFAAALTLTNNANIVTQTGANINTAAGDTCIIRATAANTVEILSYVPVTPSQQVIRNYIDGLILSTAGASTTFTVSAGQAADSSNSVMMTLASSINKTTAAWAVGTGNGSLDTGTIANNTWYHVHVIRRTDTGVVDILISLSATAPTLPTNYTQRRRIGAIRTNSSAQWVRFFQSGNQLLWDNLGALDASGTSSTTASLITLTVPTGVKVQAILNVQCTGGASQNQLIISDPDVTDVAPSLTVWPLGNGGVDVNGGVGSRQIRMTTNTSAQVRLRSTASDATVRIASIGWIDPRGENA